MRMRNRSIALLVVSLSLLLASVAAGWAELSPLLGGDRTEAQTYELLAAGDLPKGLSLASRRLALFRCTDAMTSLRHLAQPRAVATEVSGVCANLAQVTLRDDPSNSLAWLLMSIVRADEGDLQGFAADLQRSQQTGPAEQWLAGMRVELAETHRDDIGDEALAFMDGDLALMAESSAGVAAIAQRYVNQPDFRERITRVVETLSPEVQVRFLNWVTAAAAGQAR